MYRKAYLQLVSDGDHDHGLEALALESTNLMRQVLVNLVSDGVDDIGIRGLAALETESVLLLRRCRRLVSNRKKGCTVCVNLTCGLPLLVGLRADLLDNGAGLIGLGGGEVECLAVLVLHDVHTSSPSSLSVGPVKVQTSLLMEPFFDVSC